ncbi:MAG: anti-CBASS Acb1 family protein [Pseudomonadota bacterium]
MSGGRLTNVRLKDSFVQDSLTNAITGMGTMRDPRLANIYAMRAYDPMQIAAAYSSSGLMRKIIKIPAEDMVREWRLWKANSAQIEKIEAEEKRLQLPQKIRQVEVMRGCGGGALILGLPGQPNTPAPEKVGTGKLAYINVVSRQHLQFSELQDDATQAGFGEPVMWKIQTKSSQIDIHPSRVIPFRGDPPPVLLFSTLDNAFWGESRVAQVIDAVEDCDSARQSFAALIQKARNTRIGIPNLLATVADTAGEASFQRRMAAFQMAESIFSATVYDKGDGQIGEEITDAQYNFAGAKDIIMCFAMFASAVSDIPQSRLFGTAPEGMNSSGNSQQRDWNKMVGAKQTLDLSPCLDRIDPYLLGSALGSVDPSIWYQFAPLDQETPAEKATRFNTFMDAVTKVQATATVPDVALTKGVQSWLTDEAMLPALEDALEEIPEDERFGELQPDEADLEATPKPGNEQDPTQPPRKPGAPVSTTDAAPRSLYVRRNLLNAKDFIAWAKSQGFETTTPANELHVTIIHSRTQIDWMKVGQDWHSDDKGGLTIVPGGARIVEPLGDKGAVVLLFNSSALAYRREAMIEAGATSDYPEYQPHVTITYKGAGVDLAKVEPYRGELRFGPEMFEEVDDDWATRLTEK